MQLNHAILFPRHFHPILSSRWRTQSTRVIKFLDHKEAHFPWSFEQTPFFRIISLLIITYKPWKIASNFRIRRWKKKEVILLNRSFSVREENSWKLSQMVSCSNNWIYIRKDRNEAKHWNKRVKIITKKRSNSSFKSVSRLNNILASYNIRAWSSNIIRFDGV